MDCGNADQLIHDSILRCMKMTYSSLLAPVKLVSEGGHWLSRVYLGSCMADTCSIAVLPCLEAL